MVRWRTYSAISTSTGSGSCGLAATLAGAAPRWASAAGWASWAMAPYRHLLAHAWAGKRIRRAAAPGVGGSLAVLLRLQPPRPQVAHPRPVEAVLGVLLHHVGHEA